MANHNIEGPKIDFKNPSVTKLHMYRKIAASLVCGLPF